MGHELMRSLFLALLCSLILSACGGGGGGGTPPDPPVTIADPMVYLARDVGGRLQTASDPLGQRRYDIGHYQETDSFARDPTHAVTTWDYPKPSFGIYELPDDGGEQLAVEGNTVRNEGTRDGGKDYNQYFVGKNCGGTGWIVFKTDADAGWHEVVARLSIAQDPGTCPSRLSQALTRYTRRTVTFPVMGPRDTIISEHFNSASLGKASRMERTFLVAGSGRVAWQAFADIDSPLPADELARRCPDFGWNTVEGTKLKIGDCRISDQVSPVESAATGNQMWVLGK